MEESSANLQNCLEPFQTINVLVNHLLVTWDNAKEVSTVGWFIVIPNENNPDIHPDKRTCLVHIIIKYYLEKIEINDY